MRVRRQGLSASEKLIAAERFSGRALRDPAIRRARHIAIYLAFDGELELSILTDALLAEGKAVYLPVLSRFTPPRLRFTRYQPGMAMRPNRYGIPEPVRRQFKPLRELDVVLMPLTAFDAHGGRLGMGGGFYDRTFPVRTMGSFEKPKLIGVAYRWQQVEALPVEAHDRRMHRVLTD